MEQRCPACGKVFPVEGDPAAWKWRAGTAYCCTYDCKISQLTKLHMSRIASKMMMNGANEEAIRASLVQKYSPEKVAAFMANYMKASEAAQEAPSEEPAGVQEEKVVSNVEASKDYVAIPFSEELFDLEEISFSGKTRHRTEYCVDRAKGSVSLSIETVAADKAELEAIVHELHAVYKMLT